MTNNVTAALHVLEAEHGDLLKRVSSALDIGASTIRALGDSHDLDLHTSAIQMQIPGSDTPHKVSLHVLTVGMKQLSISLAKLLVVADDAKEAAESAADRLATQEALLKEAMAALDERDGGTHDGGCLVYLSFRKRCNCGHERARATLAKLRAHLEETK